MVVEALVAENMVKKMEVDSLLVKLLGIEDLYQTFSISVIAILVLMHSTEVVQRHIPVKNKNISKKRKIMKNMLMSKHL